MSDLTGQVALVTGASRGIGAAVAIELARRGAHVVITARTQGGLDATDDAIQALGGKSTLLPFDLMQSEQIDAIGPSLHARFGRLDILVSNAGALGKLTPVSHILSKDWAEVIGVNLTANLHLIRSCAPLLVAAPAGRAVFVTTGRVARPLAYWGAYGATKAALEHLVLTWADEVRSTHLRVNLFDPGTVRTAMRAEAMPGEDPKTVQPPEAIAPAIADLCSPTQSRHGEIIR